MFILAHGYQGTPSNMEIVKVCFKYLFRGSRFLVLSEYQGNMNGDIENMGRKAGE